MVSGGSNIRQRPSHTALIIPGTPFRTIGGLGNYNGFEVQVGEPRPLPQLLLVHVRSLQQPIEPPDKKADQ